MAGLAAVTPDRFRMNSFYRFLWLYGIIYLHRITENRMQGSAKEGFCDV